ncbi:hypothetical protein [Mesorhizobium kowhaii]|uniref:hypothetical protein n=1 Tax=Mesorhizobium kowhaii TaxID=1300272 RepID=UPI00406BC171
MESLKLLCRGGRYTIAGALAGPIQSIDLRDLIYKDLELFGITLPYAGNLQGDNRPDHLRTSEAVDGEDLPFEGPRFGTDRIRQTQSCRQVCHCSLSAAHAAAGGKAYRLAVGPIEDAPAVHGTEKYARYATEITKQI